MAVGGILLVDELLYFFYGADFAAGSVCCCILLLQQIIQVFLIFIGTALSNSGFVRKTFYGSFAAVIINVILNIILIPGWGPIPAFGIEGAAIGSVVALLINTLIVGHELKKVMPLKVEGKPLLHILLASVIMGIFVFIYTLIVPLSNVWLTLIPVAAGGIIYFLLLFKMDNGIRDDMKGMVENFGFRWPRWL